MSFGLSYLTENRKIGGHMQMMLRHPTSNTTLKPR